ncbi:MAG: PAS domain-containing sensor histidine kinase [Desulfuromonadaceae bacterium]|nr:PAS domain-containing sensor histidine kinase [Desulfuromonadaceae bacterium]MDD2848324.1 PAS domain-containing sensor histidine kinase [Desulfuromonadaceae bacterium]MDD4129280.1 PAS domain-containing sensor histidine kinase [Desulfuromonadaceae bacterium]
MNIDNGNSTSARDKLRRRAEECLLKKKSQSDSLLTRKATQRLVHELEVHQIELEMQNIELIQARNDVETALNSYADLYDFAPVGYLTLDNNRNIHSVNLAAASLLGGVRSRLIGRRFELFIAVQDRPIFSGFIRSVLASQIKDSCEVALLNEVGHTVVVQIEAMATASGQEIRLVMINISKRRLIEDKLTGKCQELDELNNSLEERITQDISVLRQKDQMLILQGRRAAMGEMIGNIAHQWRQPLNVLGLNIQELLVVYESTEFNKEYLKNSVSKSMELIMHMSQTIDSFRDYFHEDKEKVTFSVNQEIDRTLSLIKDSFLDLKVNIELLMDDNPMINGFPNEYTQVIMNILMNARDELVLQNIADAVISIHSFTEQDSSIVTVTDNGHGISSDIIDKLFDPYFTTKGPDKGTGIGLFMSKTIIEKNMGGRLTVRNTGSGAEFRIEV